MRICCFIDSLGSGGAQRQLVNLAVLLKERGYEIDFVVYSENQFYRHYLDEANIPVTTIKNANYFQRMINTKRFLTRYQGDIVISFLETPNFLACFSAIWRHKWKLITNELSAKETSFQGKRSRIFKFFERFADWTVCNSYNAQKMWVKYYPRYQNRISTIYNPLIIPSEIENTKIHYSGKRRIVIAASYQYLKNPVRLVEALNQLTDCEKEQIVIDWYGRIEVVPGDTRAYDEAVALIEKYHLDSSIHLNSENKEIYSEMKAADAVALISTVEGLPNAICEGMLLGKPIIMSQVSDYERLIDANGFLCDPFDVTSIRDAIRAFLNTTDEELIRMGDESKRKAEALFTPEVIIKQWEELFNKLSC